MIFEDEPYDKKLQNLLQTYIYAMIKSLKAVGAEDAAFISFIEKYTQDSRPVVLSLLEKHGDKEIHIFKDRADADRFLELI